MKLVNRRLRNSSRFNNNSH